MTDGDLVEIKKKTAQPDKINKVHSSLALASNDDEKERNVREITRAYFVYKTSRYKVKVSGKL